MNGGIQLAWGKRALSLTNKEGSLPSTREKGWGWGSLFPRHPRQVRFRRIY
jgi:hypothetical protein